MAPAPKLPARNGSALAALCAGVAGALMGATALAWALKGRDAPGLEVQPNRATSLPQLGGTPRRRYYRGRDLSRAVAISDLRAMTHRRLPRFALEYLEGGAEDEATLLRERTAYASWRFTPRTLVDVSRRTLAGDLLGRRAALPLVVGPTGLNGIFRRRADTLLAEGAARFGVPFAQSTMSNDPMEEIAKIPGLRHWWQLYVFGGEEVWRELVRRADRAGCEALILTTNAQIFGNREWQSRTQAKHDRLSLASSLGSLGRPEWLATTLDRGLPGFPNVLDFIPKDKRGFFETSDYIRRHQPTSLSWDTVGRIREQWKRPFLVKGLLNLEDVRRARDSGVDGVILSAHGGRQLDWAVAPLDLLPAARDIAGDSMSLLLAGGIRRGTDLLKALALGADGVISGRAPLYGVCAAGSAGVHRALTILRTEALDAMGLLGAPDLAALRTGPFLVPTDRLAGAGTADPG